MAETLIFSPTPTKGSISVDAVTNAPEPVGEPVREYGPGSAERDRLEAAIKDVTAGPRRRSSRRPITGTRT